MRSITPAEITINIKSTVRWFFYLWYLPETSPGVRTEGFGICVANDNLPQRSPNMEKTLWVVFCVWLFFEGGEPFGKICQGHKQNFFDKFISSPFLSWLALVFYPCMFPLYLAWNVSLRCILFFQYPLLTVYVVVLLLLFFLLPCVLLSVFKQRKNSKLFWFTAFVLAFIELLV